MAQAPGTVSKILWHFTGGPKWNAAKNRQDTRRKPEVNAYEALVSILRARELKLGQYHEVVRVRVPLLRRVDAKTGKPKIVKNAIIELQSSPVCCLSDIPITHLSYQAKRYGKMAVGFHRAAVVKHGFNPVFYSLYSTDVLRSIHQGFENLVEIDASSIDWWADEISSKTVRLECEEGHDVDFDLSDEVGSEVDDIKSAATDITDAVESAKENLQGFLAFVKTFRPREFSTIYCEREWRSTQAFSFSSADVAMIVLPKGNARYFENFVRRKRASLGLGGVPVVPWEDLIEH